MKKLDISGEKGNAFAVLAVASRLAKQIGFDAEEVCSEMISGNYNNLLRVFNKYFGSVVLLVSPEEIPGIDASLYSIEENDYI